MSVSIAQAGDLAITSLQLALAAGVGFAYSRRAATLASRGRPVPAWRIASFGLGLLAILAGLVSPLDTAAEELLWPHLVQHLLIGDLGALLLVLGLTGPLLQPLLAIRAIDRLQALTHPLVALPLWIADLYVWHLPFLYQAALAHSGVHALEHACFIGFGILMWMPLVGPLPVPSWFGLPAKLGYVVAVRFAGAVLGNVFMWTGQALYPDYGPSEAARGISPLSDQGIAGVVMLAEGGLVTLGAIAWLFLLWAKQDEERQRLLDLADARGVQLEKSRAQRAVAAGQGGRLEKRLREGGT
jgi:putative membrane protein